MIARVKFAAAAAADGALILAQSAPLDPSAPAASMVLDYGLTAAALGLLFYMIRMVLSGDLVSKKNIGAVVSQVVKETLEEHVQEIGLTPDDISKLVLGAVTQALGDSTKGHSP